MHDGDEFDTFTCTNEMVIWFSLLEASQNGQLALVDQQLDMSVSNPMASWWSPTRAHLFGQARRVALTRGTMCEAAPRCKSCRRFACHSGFCLSSLSRKARRVKVRIAPERKCCHEFSATSQSVLDAPGTLAQCIQIESQRWLFARYDTLTHFTPRCARGRRRRNRSDGAGEREWCVPPCPEDRGGAVCRSPAHAPETPCRRWPARRARSDTR